MKMTLTLTTSKRLKLFVKTIKSFVEKCDDYHIINEIYHYDDSSSYEDRIEMFNLISQLFPKAKIISHYFEPDSFIDKKRHARIMRIWKDNLYFSNNQFLFHLEDDWEFVKRFSLQEALPVFEKLNVVYVGFTQKLRQFPKNYQIQLVGNFWEWVYDKTKDVQENLFLDLDEMEEHKNPDYWCYFVNWPHFSFRPGIHRISELISMLNFSLEDEHFEVEFGLRYSEKFISFNHIDKIVKHIGDEVSSYDLNNSLR